MSNDLKSELKDKKNETLEILKHLKRDLAIQIRIPFENDQNVPSAHGKLKGYRELAHDQFMKYFNSVTVTEFENLCESLYNNARSTITIDDIKQEIAWYESFLSRLEYSLSSHPESILGKLHSSNGFLTDNKGSKMKVLEINGLRLDPYNEKLRYMNKQEVDISGKPLMFLFLLMNKANQIIEYIEIAKYAELNSYREGVKNLDVANDVNSLKRRVVAILKKCGMPEKEINATITTIPRRGYKFIS